ncbi:hypothetical protein L9F63_017746, partial [Diploptera punctata]
RLESVETLSDLMTPLLKIQPFPGSIPNSTDSHSNVTRNRSTIIPQFSAYYSPKDRDLDVSIREILS